MSTPSAPEVSVCVPTYNGDAYLSQCLNSVLMQTAQNWELIIVDDSSTDTTWEIAQTFAERDPRIRIERNVKRLGLVNNWNRCVDLARGAWVKFVFQDDLIDPRCLETMVAAGNRGAAIVACRREFVFEDGTPEKKRRYYSEHPSIESLFGTSTDISGDAICKAALDMLGINFIGEPTSVLLRRDVFERYGLFNPRLIMICDSEYWIRVASQTGLVYVPEKLASFRVHGDSTTAHLHASRQYGITLDGLILLHEYAFGEEYAALRAVARNHIPAIDLNGLLLRRAKGARWMAIDKAQRGGDATLLAEWQSFARAYPRIIDLLSMDDVAELGPLPRLKQTLLRTARKVARR